MPKRAPIYCGGDADFGTAVHGLAEECGHSVRTLADLSNSIPHDAPAVVAVGGDARSRHVAAALDALEGSANVGRVACVLSVSQHDDNTDAVSQRLRRLHEGREKPAHVLVVLCAPTSSSDWTAVADLCVLWLQSPLVGFECRDVRTDRGRDRLHALLGWSHSQSPLSTRHLSLRAEHAGVVIDASRVECVWEIDCPLGEGAVWDARNGRLLWLDIDTGRVFSHAPANGERRTFQWHETVGTVVPRARGSGFAVATRTSVVVCDSFDNTQPRVWPLGESLHPKHHRLNDGKCDPRGRLLVGSIAADAVYGETGTASLFAVDPSSAENGAAPRFEAVLGDVTVSNGIVWSLDGRTLYYIDSPTLCVFAYDYDLERASLSNRRTVLRFTLDEGVPDGMAIDGEGMLWIAHWEGARVTRNDPHTGAVVATVRVPAFKATSCAFGGPDLADLYITSARRGLDAAQLEKYPLSGSLFVVRGVGVKGAPTYEYNG